MNQTTVIGAPEIGAPELGEGPRTPATGRTLEAEVVWLTRRVERQKAEVDKAVALAERAEQVARDVHKARLAALKEATRAKEALDTITARLDQARAQLERGTP